MNFGREHTISEIDELIDNLDKAMDVSHQSNNLAKCSEGDSKQDSERIFDSYSMLLGEIWYGFLEYCKLNELEPAQQIREASAAHYQELLKMYKIRMRLSLDHTTNLI